MIPLIVPAHAPVESGAKIIQLQPYPVIIADCTCEGADCGWTITGWNATSYCPSVPETPVFPPRSPAPE